MNMVNYFIEANLGIVITYALHQALLANETNFKIQRGYLLIGLFSSMLLPLLDFRSPVEVAATLATIQLPELGGNNEPVAVRF